MAKKENTLLRIFPALGVRNYQYYFTGQLISQIGTWLQIVSEGWLVLQLTNSAFLIGVVAACATLPSLLFSLFGGVIVDRFDRKKLIIFTQFLSMIFALSLAVLTYTHLITVWQIALFAFLLGVVNSVDMPARQAFVHEMVGKDKMSSAIALNAGIFNSARVIGPSIAGILIAIVGPAGAYLINGLSYIAAIIVQVLIVPLKQEKKEEHVHPIQAIKEGVTYTISHPVIRSLIILTAIISIFGWSYTTIMPFIAKNIFNQDAAGLGYLYAATGAGALLATFMVSAFGSKISSNTFVLGGNMLFALSMIGFSLIHSIWPAYIFLFFGGFGLLSAFAVINARIQHLVEEKYRGRVLSLYLLMFVGLFPLGNFQIGLVSEHFGPQAAIRIGSIVVLLAVAAGFFLRDRVDQAHQEYLSKQEIEEGTQESMRESNKI